MSKIHFFKNYQAEKHLGKYIYYTWEVTNTYIKENATKQKYINVPIMKQQIQQHIS